MYGISRVTRAAVIVAGIALCACSGRQAHFAVKGGDISLNALDSTDFGGDLREATVGCETDGAPDPNAVYRYYAVTLGPDSNIKEFCVAEGFEDRFLAQPPDSHRGSCPGAFCGQSTTSRRGPVEHAAIQSVVSLEQSRSLKLSGSEKGDALDSSHLRTSVHQDRVNFSLSENTTCSAKLLIYNENVDREDGLAEADRIIRDDNKRRRQLNYFYNEGPTLARGSVWVQQTREGDTFKAMLIIKSKFSGRDVSELFEETILCTNKKGPITALESSNYGFRFNKVSADEWEVFSTLR